MSPNPIDLPIPAEATQGTPDDAKRALEESRQANTESNAIIDAAAAIITTLREFREVNHYEEKFKALLRGAP